MAAALASRSIMKRIICIIFPWLPIPTGNGSLINMLALSEPDQVYGFISVDGS